MTRFIVAKKTKKIFKAIKKARGSVKLPDRFKGKDIVQIIELAKKEYFSGILAK
ncbi:MAG: hypothetical protein WCK98_07775 [bacterium]